jgi:ribosome-binding protein aMBF1 (putative translation factor)
MCGKQGNMHKTLIEGTELTVCSRCSKHGKILRTLRPAIKKKRRICKQTQYQRIITSKDREFPAQAIYPSCKKTREITPY